MNITDEIMFYGGIILAGVSVLGMIIYLPIARLRKMKLDIQLDQEYGKTEKDNTCQN